MAKQLFANNASSQLAASISDADLTIQVQAGYGALYPSPGTDEYFLVTLENTAGEIEVVKVTSRSVDLLTVPVAGRGQEGTVAQSWITGQTRVEARLTRGTMETFIQRGGDAMEGNLDMDNHNVVDAHLTGSGTKMLAGEIVNVPLRGATGDSSNEVRVPTDGSRATAGGHAILTDANTPQIIKASFAVGMIMQWYGAVGSPPTGWKICDGSSHVINGVTYTTPDLRGKFVFGVDDTHAFNSTGDGEGETEEGTLTEGEFATDEHVLTVDEIPAHTHTVGDESDNRVVKYPLAGNALWVAGSAGIKFEAGTMTSSAAGGGGGHSHTMSVAGTAHSHDISKYMPAYRALYYIMYVGVDGV